MLQTEIHPGEWVALEVDHRPNEPAWALLEPIDPHRVVEDHRHAELIMRTTTAAVGTR